jgi:hypothetical protein
MIYNNFSPDTVRLKLFLLTTGEWCLTMVLLPGKSLFYNENLLRREAEIIRE